MKRLMIKRLHFADSIERRLIFSEQLLLFSTKRLSIRSNTTDWYGQEQPNVWSLWTGKHSPMLLVFESPINQMVHLQFYENCELSQVGKELGGKKKKKKKWVAQIVSFQWNLQMSFSPSSVTNFFTPNLLMLSFNVFVSMVSFPQKLCMPLKNKHKDHRVTVPMLSRGHS